MSSGAVDTASPDDAERGGPTRGRVRDPLPVWSSAGAAGGACSSRRSAWPGCPGSTARVITLFALGLAKYEVKHFHITDAKAVLESHDGLLGSDAGWYQTIAAHGYGALPRSATRFFPLLPAARPRTARHHLADGGRRLPPHHEPRRTPRRAWGSTPWCAPSGTDTVLARRAVWLIMLAPPAFVLVMGYSEALLVLLAVAFFLTIRRGTWWWAALFGYLAGTARPIGCLLVVPAAIEVVRSWPADRWGGWPGKVAAIVSSVAGTVTYLAWVSTTSGGFLEPLKIQQQQAHHGALTDPVSTIYHSLADAGPRAPRRRRAPRPVDRRRRRAASSWRSGACPCPTAPSPCASSRSRCRAPTSIRSSATRSARSRSSWPAPPCSARCGSPAVTYVLCGAAMALYAVLAFQGAYVP